MNDVATDTAPAPAGGGGSAAGRTPHLLVLGGSREGRELAARLVADGLSVTYALAGRTPRPALPPGARTHRGGFGGAAGLARWLAQARIAALVDATHPFAVRMQANAARACAMAGVPRLRLSRPPWRPGRGDRWIEVPDAAAAAHLLPRGARLLAALGGHGLRGLVHRPDLWLHARLLTPPAFAVPPRWRLLPAAPRTAVAAEMALLRAVAARWLIVRNAGGAAGRPRLLAARRLGLPVIMLARPPAPDEAAAGVAHDAHEMREIIHAIICRS